MFGGDWGVEIVVRCSLAVVRCSFVVFRRALDVFRFSLIVVRLPFFVGRRAQEVLDWYFKYKGFGGRLDWWGAVPSGQKNTVLGGWGRGLIVGEVNTALMGLEIAFSLCFWFSF